MKRLLALLMCAALCLAPVGAGASEDDFDILTSFYPMYLLTINVAGGIEGVTVTNMAEQSVGCLHDYSLRTGDMRLISAADAIIVNGAGMESFLDRLLEQQTRPVINASEGIELICGDDEHADETGHDHDEHADEVDHDHDEHADETDHVYEDDHGHDHDHDHSVNAHVWMSPRQAMAQVDNIARGLMEHDPAHAGEYRANADAYIARLAALDAQVTELLGPAVGARIVTSHPAFEYLARDYGLEIAATLGQEPGEMPRTRDMADLVDTVRAMGIRAVFVEKAYAEKAADVLSRETGISIYTLDSLTSGELAAGAYERAILEDAMILREALCDGDK